MFAHNTSFQGWRTLLPEVSDFSAKHTELGHQQGVCHWLAFLSLGKVPGVQVTLCIGLMANL